MKENNPPQWALRFFKWYCNDHLSDAVLGDMLELYDRRCHSMGKRRADLLFLWNVLLFLQPFAIRKESKINQINKVTMFKHNLKITGRNLVRNKAYSLLNISGLSIGMACSILIFLWVQNELSFDRFHSKANEIYRIVCSAGDFRAAVSPAGVPSGLQNEMPEIRSTVRLSKPRTALFEVDNIKFEEKRLFYADSNFLQMFNFPLIEGDLNTALKRPDGLVMTQSTAIKYFGTEQAMGKVIKKDNGDNFIVTGILEDIPSNSHLQFDFVLPMSHLARTNTDLRDDVWYNFNFYSYIEFDVNALSSPGNPAQLEDKVNQIYAAKVPDIKVDFALQPLSDIHLHSNYQIDVAGHGNIQYVNIFFFVAFFILIVACINFMNLATARSARRAKEVGLRKVIGARRNQLIFQFLMESVIISLISLTVAIGLVYLLLPAFGEIADKHLTFDILDGRIFSGLLAIALLTGLLSGSYPALFLSGFKPIKVLQGKLKLGGSNQVFRNGLVVAQFVVSVMMLVGTAVIYNQLNFIKDKNLGFDKENLLYVHMSGEMWGKQNALRTALAENTVTSDFSIVSEIPTQIEQGTLDVQWEGKDPNEQSVIPSMRVDENFIDVFQMEILRGRGLSDDIASDSSKYVINEEAVKVMGMKLDNVIGQWIDFNGRRGTVIGVVKDFNYKPLQYAIEPLVLMHSAFGSVTVIKVPPGSTERTLDVLEEIYGELNPAHPLTYGFIDQDLDNQYQGEQKMGTIFNLFALLAIFISCIGLYGLSAFIAEQYTKEIGIRKVLGANLIGLINLLSRNFFRLILLALIIATPMSWYFMNGWLEDFAYRVDISWWVYLIAGISVLVTTLITVSHQVVKAALTNPVDSLRSE